MCLVRRICSSRCSLCSLPWVPAEAFDALGQLLHLLCLPLGRGARLQGKLWGVFCAADRTLAILLALQSIVCFRPVQGPGYFEALVVHFFVFGVQREHERGFLRVTFAQSIIPLFPSYAVSTRFLQKPTQQPKKMIELLGPSGPALLPPLPLGSSSLGFFNSPNPWSSPSPGS